MDLYYLYQQVLKARKDGLPEPTELPKPSSPKTPTTTSSTHHHQQQQQQQRKKVINIEGFGSPPEVTKPLVDKEAVSIFFKSSTEKLGNAITNIKRNSTERFIVPTVSTVEQLFSINNKQQKEEEEEEQQQQRVVGQ